MANKAALKNSIVVAIAPTDALLPAGLVYDPPTRDATGASVGATWNGSAYVPRAYPTETANSITLRDQAEVAMVANRADIAANDTGIANNNAWLAANTGANLSTTVLTARVKILVQQANAAANQQNAQFRQLNGVIRLLLNKLDGTD